MYTCNTAVQVCGVLQCAKIHYCTCTHVTHFWNTVGFTVPMGNPTLQGPNAKEWQAMLDYEIDQLEKLGTQMIEDLPQGELIIPCSKVLEKKHGPTGKIETYWVQIVASGHKQVKGINYSETFSATVKMPSVHVVLPNAAEQDWEIDRCKECLPSSPAQRDNLYEATMWSLEARARGQSLPSPKMALWTQMG